jgi:hypothetical protein
MKEGVSDWSEVVFLPVPRRFPRGETLPVLL